MDDDLVGYLVGLIVICAIVAFVVYCILIIASAIAALAGAGGVIWGGGTALANYSKSFKENMVDSNRVVA